jgi:hypothetical protein
VKREERAHFACAASSPTTSPGFVCERPELRDVRCEAGPLGSATGQAGRS